MTAEPPIVFLGIDGVLNLTRSTWSALPAPPARQRLPGRRAVHAQRVPVETSAIEAGPLVALERLLSSLRPRVVLSSDWRANDNARAVLASSGLTIPWHDDWRTDCLPDGRGAQIDRWLAAHSNPFHVIINGNGHGLGNQRARLVRTSPALGLTRDSVRLALDIILAQRRAAGSRPSPVAQS